MQFTMNLKLRLDLIKITTYVIFISFDSIRFFDQMLTLGQHNSKELVKHSRKHSGAHIVRIYVKSTRLVMQPLFQINKVNQHFLQIFQ